MAAEGTTEIKQVELNDVPDTCEIGGSVRKYSYTDSDRYTAEGSWHIFNRDSSGWDLLDDGVQFQNGETYWFYLEITTNNGYTFSNDVKLLVNGNEWLSASNSPWMATELDAEKYVSFGTPIEDLSDLYSVLKEPKIGDSTEDIAYENEAYMVRGTWKYEDGSEITSGSTFEKGKKYKIDIIVIAKSGYYFSEDFVIQMGDEQVQFHTENKARATAYYEKSFATKISEAEITLPKTEVGKVLQPEQFDIPVASDANYTVKGRWEDASRNPITVEKTVKEGEAYCLSVFMEANKGYEFDTSFLVTVDGLLRKPNNDGEWARFDVYYSLRKSIDRVEVNGVEVPAVGQGPVSKDSLKVPDGAHYSVSSVELYDVKTFQPVSVCQNGGNYGLKIVLQADAGYEFTNYTKMYMDGERTDGNLAQDTAIAHVWVTFSYEKVISEVHLNNVPTMKVGETAKADVTVPDGATYEIETCWWLVWNDVKEDFEPYSGIFEANKVYSLDVQIKAADGYRLDKDATVYYVNGKTADLEEMGMYYANYSVEYAEGLQVIDRVEFTVEEPVMGRHASIGPNVSVPNGAHYKVDAETNSWVRGRPESAVLAYDEIFSPSGSYGISLYMVADEGYVFAEDMTVVVNGVEIEELNGSIGRKLGDFRYFFESACAHEYSEWEAIADGTHFRKCLICGRKESGKHIYDNASDNICNVCGYDQTAGSPKTGDSFAIGALLAVMALSAATVVLCVDRKRGANI